MAGSQWYGQISQMMGNTADSTIYGKVDMLKKIWNVYAGIKMEDEKPPRFKDGFARLYLDTSNLMFSPDYKDLPLENRTSFGETILRTGLVVEELGIEKAQVKCASLAKTCLDPWGCNLNLNEAQNSVENFFTSEPGEIARARIERLILNGDEQTAFRLCNSYVTAKEPEFWRNNDMSSNLGDNILDKELFPVFVQLVKLLSKLSDLRAIVERTSCLSCHEGIRIIRVFLTENTEDSLRLSLILTEIFLLRDLINPNIFCCTKELMEIWSDLQLSLKVEQALVQDSAWKIIVYHASTSAHFYLFVDVLWQRYGNLFNNLYIEFFIRGLTSDLNHLEVTRVSSPMSIVHELETHIAAIYAKFSKLFQNELDIARECLLSAFALRPSPELLNDLNDMCIALNDLHGLSPSQQFDNCEVIRPGDDSRGIVAIVPANSEAVGLISGPVLYQEPSFKPPEISETLNKTRFNFDSILQKELAKNHNGLVNPNVSTDSVNTSDSSRTELNGETSRKCNCEGRCTTPDLQQRIPCRTYPFEHPILHSKSHSFPLGVLEDLTTIIENTRSVRWRNFTDWRYFPERAEDFLNDYIRNQQTRKAPNNDSDGDGSATEYEDEQQALPLLSSVKAEPYTPKVVVPVATAPPQQPKKPIKVYSDSETETDEESDSFDTTSSSSEDITNSDQTWEEKRKKSIRKAKKNTRNNPNERNRLINQILRSTRKKKHRKVKGDKDRESRNKASKKKRRHKYNRIKEPPIETTQSDDNSSSEVIKVITSKKSQMQTQTQPRPQPRPRQKSIDVNNPAQVESIVGTNPRIMLSRLAVESQQKTPEKVAQKPKPVVVVATTTTTTALVPSAIPSTSAGFTKQDVRTKLQVSLLAKQAHVNKGALQIPPQQKIVEKQTQQQLPPPPPPTVTIIKTEGVEHLDTIINSVAAGNTPIAITTTTVQKTAPGSVLLKKKSSKKLLGITALKNPASSATATVAPLSKTVRKILKDRQLKKKKKKKKNVCHIQTQTDYFPPDLSMVPRLASDYLAPPPPTVLVKYKPGQPEIELNLNSQTPPFLNKYFSDLDGSPSFTVGGIFTYCTLTPPSQSFPKSFKELSYTDSIDSLKVMSQFYKPPTKLKTGSRVAKSSSKSTLQSKGKKQLTNIIKTSSPKSGQKSKKSVKNASPAVSQNVALENTNATVQNPITSTQNVVAVQNTHITTQNAIDAVQNVTTTQNAVAATAQNPNVTAQKTKVVVPKSEVKTTTTIISNTSTTQSQVIAFKTIMINGKIVAVPISTAGGASTRLPVATKSVVHKLKTVNIRPQQQQCVVRPIVSNSVVLNQTLPVTGVPLYVVGQQQQQNTAGRNPPPQQGVVRVQQTVINPAPTKTKKVWTTQRKHGEMTYRKAENSGIQDIDHGLVACIREMKTKLHKKGVAPAQSNNIPPPTNTTTNSVLVSESNVSVSGLSAFDSSQQWASSSMEPTMVNAASQSTEPIPPPPPAVAAPIQLKNILDQALDEAEVPKTIIDSKDLEELSFPIDYLQQLDDADCAQADPESRAETATLYAAPPTERDALCSPNEFDFLNDAASPTSGMSGSFSPNSGNEKAKKKRKKVESGEQPDLGSPQPPKKKKHHGPPVVCPLCNKTMASSYNLRRHLKQVHHIELNSPKIDKELEKYLNSLKTSSNDLKPAVDEAPFIEGLSARLLGPDQIKVEDGSGAIPSEDPLPPVPVPAPKPKTSRPKKPSAKKRKADVVPGQETPSETVSTIVDKVIEGELGIKSTSKRAQQTGEKKPRKPRPPRTPKSKQTTPKSKETPPKAILPFGNSSTQFNVAEFNEMLCNDPVLKSLHDRFMGSENTNFVSDCVRNTMESIINQVVECSFKDNPPPSTSSLECSANSEGAKPTITVPLVKTRELEKAMDPKSTSTSTVAQHRNETNLDVRSCQSIFEALKEARFKSLAMLNENSQDIAMNLGHTEPEKDDNSSRNVGSKDDWIMDVNQSLSMADNMDFDNLLDMDLNKVLDDNDKDMGNILDPMKPEELMDQQELELSIKAMMESISTDGPRQQLDATNYNPVNQGVMAQLLEEDLDSVVTTRSQEVIAKDGLDFVNADHKCMRENMPETKGITEDLTPMLLEQINAPEVTATGTELVKTQPEGIEDSAMQNSKTLPGAIEASVAVSESTRGSLVVTDSEAPRLAVSFAIANNNSKPFAEPIEAPRTILNSVEDSKAVLKPVEESKTVPEPVEESKTLPEPLEESKTVLEPVEESKTVPEPVEESMTLPEPVEESKTVPEHVEESKTVPEPVEELKTVPEPVEESKTVPEPVEESKTVPEPVEESKTVPEPVEESKTVPEPVEESKTVPEPVEESKTVPGPVEESKTVREPVEESKTVPEPVEESKTVPEHVEESKTVPEPFEESKTVPEPFEESKTVPEPAEESKTVPEPVEESKTVPEPIGDSKSVNETVEASTAVPEPVEETKTVPETVEVSKSVPEAVDSKTVPDPVEDSKSVNETVEDSKSGNETVEDSKSAPKTVDDSKTVPEPIVDSKTVPETVEDSKSAPKTVENSKTIPKTISDSAISSELTVPKNLEDSNIVPEPIDVSVKVPEPVTISKTVLKDSKTASEPLKDLKTTTKPTRNTLVVNMEPMQVEKSNKIPVKKPTRAGLRTVTKITKTTVSTTKTQPKPEVEQSKPSVTPTVKTNVEKQAPVPAVAKVTLPNVNANKTLTVSSATTATPSTQVPKDVPPVTPTVPPPPVKKITPREKQAKLKRPRDPVLDITRIVLTRMIDIIVDLETKNAAKASTPVPVATTSKTVTTSRPSTTPSPVAATNSKDTNAKTVPVSKPSSNEKASPVPKPTTTTVAKTIPPVPKPSTNSKPSTSPVLSTASGDSKSLTDNKPREVQQVRRYSAEDKVVAPTRDASSRNKSGPSTSQPVTGKRLTFQEQYELQIKNQMLKQQTEQDKIVADERKLHEMKESRRKVTRKPSNPSRLTPSKVRTLIPDPEDDNKAVNTLVQGMVDSISSTRRKPPTTKLQVHEISQSTSKKTQSPVDDVKIPLTVNIDEDITDQKTLTKKNTVRKKASEPVNNVRISGNSDNDTSPDIEVIEVKQRTGRTKMSESIKRVHVKPHSPRSLTTFSVNPEPVKTEPVEPTVRPSSSDKSTKQSVKSCNIESSSTTSKKNIKFPDEIVVATRSKRHVVIKTQIKDEQEDRDDFPLVVLDDSPKKPSLATCEKTESVDSSEVDLVMEVDICEDDIVSDECKTPEEGEESVSECEYLGTTKNDSSEPETLPEIKFHTPIGARRRKREVKSCACCEPEKPLKKIKSSNSRSNSPVPIIKRTVQKPQNKITKRKTTKRNTAHSPTKISTRENREDGFRILRSRTRSMT